MPKLPYSAASLMLAITMLVLFMCYTVFAHGGVDFTKLEPFLVKGSGPQQVHIVFGADASEYVVSWVSFPEPNKPQPPKSLVQYGPTPFQLPRLSTATPFVFKDEYCGSQRYMHHVLIRGLVPGERVFYRVGSDGQTWSNIFQFVVADRDNTLNKKLTVSLVGDMTVPPICKNSSVPQWALDTRNGVHDFVLHYGDIAYNLADKCNQVGDYYMQQAESVGAYTAYVFGTGNHEADQNYSYASYINRYAGQMRMAEASGSQIIRWFSFDAQLVHFVLFDTDAWIFEPVFEKAKPQLAWMRADLAKVNRAKTPWIIVLGHRAMYCTKNDDSYCNSDAEAIRNGVYVNSTKLFDGIEPLLIEFGVDLFMAGHTHHYMRTWPVKRGALVQNNYINPKATVHVQSGIGGVDDTNPFELPMKSYDAWRDETLRSGFSRLVIHNATHLSFTQHASWDGSVFDSFDLVQTSHGPFS